MKKGLLVLITIAVSIISSFAQNNDTLQKSDLITVSGIATNGNPGAYILTDNYEKYFIDIEQLTEWDANLYLEKRVKVAGELKVVDQDKFIENENGHSVIHQQFNVIFHATYKIIGNHNE